MKSNFKLSIVELENKNQELIVIDHSLEIIEKPFKVFEVELNRLKNACLLITVENDASSEIAMGNIKQINSIISSVERLYSDKKRPILEYTRMLDEIKNRVIKIGEETVSAMKLRISSYQQVQAAIANKKAEEERAKLEEKRKVIEGFKTEINRIATKINAMTFGGQYQNPSGEIAYAPMPNLEGLKKIKTIVEQLITNSNSYPIELRPHYETIINNATEIINKQILILETKRINGEEPVISIEEINNGIIENSKAINQMNVSTGKMVKKMEMAIEKDVKSAEKGLSRKIEYNLVDINKVPIEFLMVDEKKVKAYFVEKRKEILSSLKDGSKSNYEIINGLHVSVNVNVIAK